MLLRLPVFGHFLLLCSVVSSLLLFAVTDDSSANGAKGRLVCRQIYFLLLLHIFFKYFKFLHI